MLAQGISDLSPHGHPIPRSRANIQKENLVVAGLRLAPR